MEQIKIDRMKSKNSTVKWVGDRSTSCDVYDVFTALHVMQTRYSDENSVRLSVRPSVRPSVCPSVCLSVTRVDCDKTEERSATIFIPYER